jgi:hypothetical protein
MKQLERYDDDMYAAACGLPARVRATEGPFPGAAWTHAQGRSYATVDGIEVSVYGGTQPSDRPGEHTILVSVQAQAGEAGQHRVAHVQQYATGQIDGLGGAICVALDACRAALAGVG